MDNCCCVELKVTEDPIIALDIKEQFVSGGEITPTGTKEISVTQNGTTNTDVTYYANAKVVANVPNTYAAADEGKVVQDGDLEAQTTATFQTNDTYDTTTIKQVTVDVPASAVDSGYVYINENDTHDVTGYAQAVVDVPASAVDTGTKNITANGNNQDVVGYAAVNVNVPNTYAAGDEGKVVDNGALVSQGSATYTINSTYDTTKIKSVTVNVSGGGSPTLQTKSVSYTPSESQQTAQVTADQGYDALQEVDVTVGAVSSTYVGSGITRRDDNDLTASGPTVSVPAGYYESSASKAVSSGTAGTPTATKGTVSNHSVSVTPSVTNSAGYVASETKTGTAVTVSASELVSGTKSITANGTGIDVMNYEKVDVAVGGGGGGGSTTVASGTFTGNNGSDTSITGRQEFSIGSKMAQTDFGLFITADDGADIAKNTSRKFIWLYLRCESFLGGFDLSSDGNKTFVASSYSVDSDDSGTITTKAAGILISFGKQLYNGSVQNISDLWFQIRKYSDHFGLAIGISNPAYMFTSECTYSWKIVYFGSNPSTDIVEIS